MVFYDILVYGQSEDKHTNHISLVLETLMQHKIHSKRFKCWFICDEIQYLGHIMSRKGIQTEPLKVESMVKWLKPRNLKSLKGFLGLLGYYRRFIKDSRAITCPLTMLLKK